jgi:type I restriction enzyme S subunit
MLNPVDRRSVNGSETLLSVRRDYGVVVYSEHFKKPPQSRTTVGFKLVRRGDLVVNRLQANNGLIFHSTLEGLTSPDFSILEAKRPLEMEYLGLVLRTHAYRAHFRREATGFGDGRSGFLRLYDDRLLITPVILPPVEEQRAIVRFVDHADRLIRGFIRAKKKLIALLNEHKQALIHKAVTRGLDPKVKLKASGIPWLGDVPEHWEVVLSQRIFKEEIRPHEGRPETPLSLSQKDGLIATSAMQERSLQTSTYANWKVTVPGDLVLNRFKAHLGVFFASTLRGIVSFHYGVFSPRRALVSKYFELLYHTNPYRTIFAGRSNGMTVGLQNLSNQNFYNVRSVVPPLHEQQEIVSFAEKGTAGLNAAIDAAHRQILLLQEYRTRLVADVVTGRLDVREVAARLPDEAEVPDAIEEAEDLVESEEETEDSELEEAMAEAGA